MMPDDLVNEAGRRKFRRVAGDALASPDKSKRLSASHTFARQNR
jgi:hypothetical protein